MSNGTTEYDLLLVDTKQKLRSIVSQFAGKNIWVSYSGGADSDVMLHLIRECGFSFPALFNDTGVEFSATYKHIEYMQSIGYEIHKTSPTFPVPLSALKHGQPFISKYVSGVLQRLQKHGFDFKNDGELPFDVLYQKYPRCKSALRWWTNNTPGKRSNISWNRYLKEFLIEYGLPFNVSGLCCDKSKKNPVAQFAKQHSIDLMMMGIRRAEGGGKSYRLQGVFCF